MYFPLDTPFVAVLLSYPDMLTTSGLGFFAAGPEPITSAERQPLQPLNDSCPKYNYKQLSRIN